MKYLILVRHGDYDSNYNLSGYGSKQIKALAEKLNSYINGKSVKIITSPASRASQSADILSSFFNTKRIQDEALVDGSYLDVFELIKKNESEVEVLILVTHYEYVQSFPRFFGKKELNAELNSKVIEKGEAWLIDCQEKKLTHIQ